MPVAVNDVVLWERRRHRGREAEHIAFEAVICRLLVSEKAVAALEPGAIQYAQPRFRIVTVARHVLGAGPVLRPFKTPLKGPDNPVIRTEAEPVLPILHPAPVDSSHRANFHYSEPLYLSGGKLLTASE